MYEFVRSVYSGLLAALVAVAVVLILAPWDSAIAEHAAEPLDGSDLIVRRWETAEGVSVLDPEVIPVWQYVQEGDFSAWNMEWQFRSAFESDIHAGDLSFHNTHELIDGQEW